MEWSKEDYEFHLEGMENVNARKPHIIRFEGWEILIYHLLCDYLSTNPHSKLFSFLLFFILSESLHKISKQR